MRHGCPDGRLGARLVGCRPAPGGARTKEGVCSMWARAGVAASVAAVFCCVTSTAWGAATPGWECVPATAGQPVLSGGTGSTPSCGAGTTSVLAPTFVAAGVGGKATVQLSGVNVQIVDGAGSTSTLNGTGNLVLGYDT